MTNNSKFGGRKAKYSKRDKYKDKKGISAKHWRERYW